MGTRIVYHGKKCSWFSILEFQDPFDPSNKKEYWVDCAVTQILGMYKIDKNTEFEEVEEECIKKCPLWNIVYALNELANEVETK